MQMFHPPKKLLLLAGLSVAACFLGAAAPPPSAPQVKAILDCRALAAPDQRLACFDKAAQGLAAAESSGDLLTLDRQQRREVRRQSFGLALPSFSVFERGEKPEDVDSLNATIAQVARSPRGAWVITLDDGAVWRQIDDDAPYRDPRPGMKATIHRATMGSYKMSIDGVGMIRVHRDS